MQFSACLYWFFFFPIKRTTFFLLLWAVSSVVATANHLPLSNLHLCILLWLNFSITASIHCTFPLYSSKRQNPLYIHIRFLSVWTLWLLSLSLWFCPSWSLQLPNLCFLQLSFPQCHRVQTGQRHCETCTFSFLLILNYAADTFPHPFLADWRLHILRFTSTGPLSSLQHHLQTSSFMLTLTKWDQIESFTIKPLENKEESSMEFAAEEWLLQSSPHLEQRENY